MRLAARILPGDAAPETVLRRLVARARARGLPPPAALTGEWFGSTAVLAPSVAIEPVAATAAEAYASVGRPPAVPAALDTVGAPVRGAVDGTVHDAASGTVHGPASGDAVGGGWIGYLGYGLTDPRPRARRRLPLAAWGWADHVLRRDRHGRWWFEALVADDAPFPEALAVDLAACVRAAAHDTHLAADLGSTCGPVDVGGRATTGAWRAHDVREPDRALHEDAIRRCHDAIRAGDVYQANVCTRYELRLDGDPADVFAAGVARHAPRRAAYLHGRWGALVSFSPELFLARHGRRVRSSPIKGTDRDDPARLLASVKDRAENVMIVDLVRNDLGRVCEPGSVSVPELLVVRRAPGVWHLVSTVDGVLRPGVTDAQLLAAAFPPGSVTGTPKLRALELLAELEPVPREVYCGAIGMMSPVAGLELNVAIRTIEIAPGGDAWIGVGGGITIDSVPAAEWAECLAKAAPLLDLLGRDVARPPLDVTERTEVVV